MTDYYLHALTLAAALGCGLMAGIFFEFSNFVMQALAQISRDHGIVAMQAINVTVLNPLFMLAFFGTALMCAASVALALIFDGKHGTVYLLAGSALYLLGNIGVTAVFNVPMKDVLARIDATAEDAIPIWQHYLKKWAFWNHVRTVTALCAAGAFMLGTTVSAS
ncbi:MAG: anthrone oxygenase family protein [Gallionella sp.]